MIRQQKLNKILIFIGLFFLTEIAVSQNLENLYVNMPDGLNPTLSKQNRLELLEYFKAGQGDSVTNRFGNQAYLQFFDTTQQCLVVRNTKISTFEMKVFTPENEAPVIGIINTVCAPVCQSVIQFYDTAWAPVALQFTLPKAIEWLDKDKLQATDLDQNWVEKQLGNGFISLSFSRTDNGIIVRNNTLQYLSEKDRNQLLPLLSDKPFRYELKDKSWNRVQ